jgi:hypothetical protein
MRDIVAFFPCKNDWGIHHHQFFDILEIYYAKFLIMYLILALT